MMSTRSFRRIQSEDNALFRSLKKLTSARGLKKSGSVLVAGPKTICDLIASCPDRCQAWIDTDGQPAPPPALPAGAAWYRLSRALFRAIDIFGTGAPLLLMRAPAIGAWRREDGLGDGCTLFVPFQDPENVGAVVRSAAAFGVGDVVLLEECGHPFHPRAVRASGGAVFHVALRNGPSISDLPRDLPLVALSAEGSDVAAFEFPERFGLVPGLEGPGLPEALRAGAIAIPISSQVESLNAATATAIALYAWAKGRRPSRPGRA
jgi:16S rRNA (guanine527-N7)-methyltransferase